MENAVEVVVKQLKNFICVIADKPEEEKKMGGMPGGRGCGHPPGGVTVKVGCSSRCFGECRLLTQEEVNLTDTASAARIGVSGVQAPLAEFALRRFAARVAE